MDTIHYDCRDVAPARRPAPIFVFGPPCISNISFPQPRRTPNPMIKRVHKADAKAKARARCRAGTKNEAAAKVKAKTIIKAKSTAKVKARVRSEDQGTY